MRSIGKGTFIVLLAEFENGQCCFTSLGELGRPAERVADQAVDDLKSFFQTDGAVDQFLADQIILPACLADGPSVFRTARVTLHLLTNIEIVKSFLPISISIGGRIGESGVVHIKPRDKPYK